MIIEEIPGAGAGGGEGGGGGDGGGTTVAELPPETTTEVIPSSEPAAGGETAPGLEAEPGGEKPAGEEEPLPELQGKQADDKFTKALRELKKVDPVAAKSAADAYFSNQALLKEAGAKNTGEAIGVLRQLKATVQSLGGEEGIQDMQQEIADYREEVAQFGNGDKKLIEKLADGSVEKTANMTINAIEVIRERDAKAFDNVILPFLAERLEKSELPQRLAELYKFIEEGKGQEAYDLTRRIMAWAGGIKDLAGKQSEARKASTAITPEMQRLQEERKDLNEQKSKLFHDAIGSEVMRLNDTATSQATTGFFRDINLRTEGQREFIGGLRSRIYAAMRADVGYLRLVNALKNKGDAHAVAEFMAAKYAELLPIHFEKHRNALYPNYKKTAAAAKPNGTAAGAAAAAAKPAAAAATVNYTGGTPKYEDVDWHKTSDVEWIAGYATLKNGKRVKWH